MTAARDVEERRGRTQDAVSGAVYGTLAAGLVLAAEDGSHGGYAAVVEATAVSLALYWLAHSYAALVAMRIARRRAATLEATVAVLRRKVPILVGGAIPVAVLVVEALLGVRLRTAVLAALWSCVGTLFLLELFAGLRAGEGRGRAVAGAFVGGALGLALLLVKALLH